MYKISTDITLLIPDNYKGKQDEVINYIRKETGLNYEVISVSKRAYEENNNISTFDLKLLFTIRDKKRTSELVGDLQSKFIKLYGCENKKIKILLNEVYVKLEEEK